MVTATEGKVIRRTLGALLARNPVVESWLHDQVASAFDALKADPSRAVPIYQVKKSLESEHAKAIRRS